MEIKLFDKQNNDYILEAQELLANCFPHCYSENPSEEVDSVLQDDRVSFIAVEDNKLIGLIGAMPQYGETAWELHPLAVNEKYRKLGVGKKLVNALECELKSRGCITLYLGTDDEFDKTSLYGVDLYDNTYKKIENIINTNNHSFGFYQKVGYKIVGVIPDANGLGKPDIFMAKRIS